MVPTVAAQNIIMEMDILDVNWVSKKCLINGNKLIYIFYLPKSTIMCQFVNTTKIALLINIAIG